MNEFSQSVPVPICKRSIQRRLDFCKNTDGFDENRNKIVRDSAEIDITLDNIRTME